MVLTRAQNQPGPDGVLGTADDVQDANNTDTPWVDQSQTYTSHASHQVFLREYELNAANHPVSTGKLLGGLVDDDPITAPARDGALPQRRRRHHRKHLDVGVDQEAGGRQARPAAGGQGRDEHPDARRRSLRQLHPRPAARAAAVRRPTDAASVEGNLASPVPVPANVVYFDTPFLTDIAHNADPSCTTQGGPPVCPTPDPDLTASADFAHQPAGTYDDEMLNDHFTCGDGRCNENIALSAIHQIFHHEHDRLVDDIKGVLTNDTSPGGAQALKEWKPSAGPSLSPDGWNGSRLFQAARFVTEMEYQHLVFEEFARKVQPMVRPFHIYNPDINAAIPAEFAAAVYRFGHSMLDDDVARTNEDGSDNSIPLLNGFLNPPEYFNGGTAGTLTPEQAAGTIVMGSSDQVGNELDEFVTETLRNNLLGLPLDLPAINMTRARDVGIPPLNQFRRQVFAQTNDGQLAPYTSWSDFGQHLKHPESLINFVAAYGLHPTITGATTLAGKRAAARAIVDPVPGDVPPPDAADFMFSTGAWADASGGLTITGLDNVDMWVGGLAEITNLFGGLLGSTFNYVFQLSLENLQEGDRFYYLARTPGMNLRTQLEGNSFSELIQRNTDGTNTLKADAFATRRLQVPARRTDVPGTGGELHHRPRLDCRRPADDRLRREPAAAARAEYPTADNPIQYRQFNNVDPSGINGQAVYNGTPGVDRVFGGNDNDTFWGGPGKDVIEGNGGDDIALGGDDNDIITDLGGADVHKGGPGNDAIDTGIGDDISMGGDGQDFMNGGANDNEAFAGPGNDFVIAGQGADAVFGDGGDDWIQGGSGQDLLQGDHAAPFFDDPAQTRPGNDIFIGQVGENDYDAEGGDDLMAQNAAVDRNAGVGRLRLGVPPVRHRRCGRRHDDQPATGRRPDPGRRQPRPLAGGRSRLGIQLQRRPPRRRHRGGRRSWRVRRLRCARSDRCRPDRWAQPVGHELPVVAQLRHRRIGHEAVPKCRLRRNSARPRVGQRLGRGQHPPRWRRQRPDRRPWQRRHRRRRPCTSGCHHGSYQPGKSGLGDRQDRPHGAPGDVGELRARDRRDDAATGGVRRPGRSGQPRRRARDRRPRRGRRWAPRRTPVRPPIVPHPPDAPTDGAVARTVKVLPGTANCDTAAFLAET